MPPDDHVSVSTRMRMSGAIKRVKDIWDGYRYRESIQSNIFAPTAAVYLFQHLQKIIPNHSLILADFDCFLNTYSQIKGVNAPLISNKLLEPTKWETYQSYLVPRGAADICFPSDFNYLQHAYG